MLTRRCYKMLEQMNQVESKDGPLEFSIERLCGLTNIPFWEVSGMANLLELHGYLESRTTPVGSLSFSKYFSLTESGRRYKEIRRMERVQYLIDKWIDIVACIISIIALIVSVHTSISG